MSQMPHIKAEVNMDKEREKKKSGLAALLSRLTGGGSGAGGATGGVGGFGGAAATGGLLATKAGLIGLVLAGTTVAGGIGMVGWTAFGPGQGDRSDNPALQLFASRPKETTSPFGAASVPADGNSSSLNYLAQANSAKAGEASGEAAPTDATAASAATEDAAAGSAQSATPHMGESVATNGAAPRTGLKDAKKFGELSKSFGGGSGGSGGASASAAPLNTGAAASNAGGRGSLGGGIGQRSASQSTGRGISRARAAGSTTRAAMNALQQNRGAQSSQAGGRQYDGGSVTGGGMSGPDAGLPGAGGPGLGSGGSQPTSTPNSAAQKNEFEAPPTPESRNVTPWQKAINMAGMLLGAAMLLIVLIGQVSKMPGGGTAIAYILAGLAAVLGLAVVALGAQISGGKYGQPLQGGLLAIAGGAVAAAAVMAAATMGNDAGSQGAQQSTGGTGTGGTGTGGTGTGGTGTGGTGTGGTGTGGTGTGGVGTGSTVTGNASAGSFLSLSPWVLLVGGAGMVAMAGAMMTKPKSYPSEEFDGRKVPDFGYQVKPGESVRYTA